MSPHRPPSVSIPDEHSATSSFREINGLDLHVVAAGERGDPLVVFLHGFPEFWYEWEEFIEPFVEAGYRVLIPDQRGYNRSDKPPGVASYRIDKLSGDIQELIATEGRESAHVIGHDWGAAVAWDLALRRPESLERLGIINVPHPTVFEQTLKSNPTQMRKSWYMFVFQLPWLPEWYLARTGFGFFQRTMRGGSRPKAFNKTDFERYRSAWSKDGALSAMISWYRALFRYSQDPPRETVEAPTMVLWGENDQALIPEMASRSMDYCDNGELKMFPDATHWLPHEYPSRVVDHLLNHLAS